jgi:hypothetical protein
MTPKKRMRMGRRGVCSISSLKSAFTPETLSLSLSFFTYSAAS